MASNTNEDLIRSHVDTIILSALMKEDKYGLEILNEIKEKSEGLYTLKQATLYSILKRLEKVGFIRSYDGTTSNGAARVYYTLLDDGRNAVLADQYEWEYSRTIINNLLSDKPYDPNSEPPFDASALRPLTKRQSNPKPEVKEQSVAQPASQPQAQSQTSFDQPPIQQIKPIQAINYGDYGQEEDQYDNNIYHDPAPARDKPNFDAIFNTRSEYQNTQKPKVAPAPAPKNDNNDGHTTNYITMFKNLYNNSNSSVSSNPVSGNSNEDEDSYDFYTISEMKTNFAREGYTIRPYYKKNTTQYYVGKYYKANQLLLVSSLVFYALMLIEIFALHFGLHYSSQVTLWLSIAAITLVPGYALVKWIMDPNRRSLAKFSLKTALINSLIIIINMVIIIVIVGYFAFHANFADPSTMVKPIFAPLAMLLNIPIAILIYELLYRSKYFHIN